MIISSNTPVQDLQMSQLKINITANYIGRAWTVIMSLAFIPLYIKFLGIEAYGLIGFWASLFALSSVLDLGLSSTINRELARYSARIESRQKMRDLLRTLEFVYWGVAVLIGVIVLSLSKFISHYWINAENLSTETVERSIALIGVVITFQWPLSFYTGGLLGLQRQVMLNAITSVLATLRGGGAVLILWLVSPTITAFFTWQIFINLSGTVIMALALWGSLPEGEREARFDKQLLYSVWHFAAGVTGASVAWVLLSQLDKILLSTLLPLNIFGYYMLAVTIASVLGNFFGPVYTAIFPRFSQLAELNDRENLTQTYHRASQLMSTAILPIASVLAIFSYEVLLLWTGDPVVAKNTHVLATLLVLGSASNGLVYLPYALQLAYGWTSLCLYFNIVTLALMLPFMFLMVNIYGAVGAAIVWVILNASYAFFYILIMHRRLLQGEQWKWYLEDVGRPLAAVLSVTGFAYWLFPSSGTSRPLTILYLVLVLSATLFAAIIAAPQMRMLLKQYSFSWMRKICYGYEKAN